MNESTTLRIVSLKNFLLIKYFPLIPAHTSSDGKPAVHPWVLRIHRVSSARGRKKPLGVPYGKSDYKIYPVQKTKRAICTTFYTLLGQMAAVAGVFSFCDMHMENLIVHRYLPYLIDLENSLTRQINSLADTEMLGDKGCVCAIVKQTIALGSGERSTNRRNIKV